MFNLGMGEITVIVLLALIFIGPKKLPELASGLGKLIREIRKTTSDVKNEIQLDEAIRKPFEELREAVTLHPEELKRRDRIRQELEAARRAAVEAEKLIAEAEALAAVPGEGGTSPPSEGAAGDGAPGGEASVASGIPASSGAGAAAGGGTTLPTPGVTPPLGTVPREPASQLASSSPSSSLPSSLKRPLAGPGAPRIKPPAEPARAVFGGTETSRREAIRGAGAHQPLVDSAADRSNTTQALTEADLAAVVGTPPPPPPSSARTGRTYPPPPPRLPGATPVPALRPNSGKSGPMAAVPAPAPANGSRSGAVSGPGPADGAKSAPLASASSPAPSAAEEASEKKPAPST